MPISTVRFDIREFQKHCLRGINDPVSRWQCHHKYLIVNCVWDNGAALNLLLGATGMDLLLGSSSVCEGWTFSGLGQAKEMYKLISLFPSSPESAGDIRSAVKYSRVPSFPLTVAQVSLKPSCTSLAQRAASLLWCVVASLAGHLPYGSDGKEAACSEGDAGSVPGSERSPGEGNGYSPQYSCLENAMDREAGGLQSTLSQRLRHAWLTNTHTRILDFLGPKLRAHCQCGQEWGRLAVGALRWQPSALCRVRGQLTNDAARVHMLSRLSQPPPLIRFSSLPPSNQLLFNSFLLPTLIKRRRQWHPPQYPCLENPMDGGAWSAAVSGVTKTRTRLSDFTFTFHFRALESEMAAHSSVLAWRIPGPAEPGGLPSMGPHRVGHDWSDLAAAHWLSVSSYVS